MTINYQQSGSPQQLIAKGIDFMFESNTDIVCHILEAEGVSLDFVQQLLEGFDSRKFEMPKKGKNRVIICPEYSCIVLDCKKFLNSGA